MLLNLCTFDPALIIRIIGNMIQPIATRTRMLKNQCPDILGTAQYNQRKKQPSNARL